ncbi:MAG: hypothetical protein QG608_3596 [Actinomycetota bacterium]|nr:hypothetical protein [Actinomycetota bacterium]
MNDAQVEAQREALLPRRLVMLARLLCAAYLVTNALLVLVRLTGLDAGSPLAVPIATLPCFAIVTAVLLPLLMAARARQLVVVATVLVGAQAILLGPRFIPREASVPEGGTKLRVLTCNTGRGQVDPAALVNLVRTQKVDVLALQELTGAGISALDAAGLNTLMPHRELHPESDSSLYSRLPLSNGHLIERPTTWQQTAADLTVGSRTVHIVVVHTSDPVDNVRWWNRDMLELRGLAREGGRDTLMLGDFNATLDHSPLRALLDGGGLSDVHLELGRGWAPTWPVHEQLPPFVQLDHVLHGRGIVGVGAWEHTVPGTDHRAVLAELVLMG